MVGVGEAERGEPLLHDFGRQCARARERLEDRREEESLVDRSHLTLVAALHVLERLERGRAWRDAKPMTVREPDAHRLVGRDGVGLLLVPELDPVLEGSQERVCLGQTLGVGALDVPGVDELDERVERRGGPDRLVVSTVDELQELHPNSTSRMPPRPRLSSRSVSPFLRISSSERAFIARASRTASGSSRSGHTYWRIISK